MECNCPYAEDGHHCKHEAALLIAIEKEREKQTQITEIAEEYPLSLTNVYFTISRNHRNAKMIHHHFINELRGCFEQINCHAQTYSSSCFLQVTKLLEEVDNLPYDRKHKEAVYDEFMKEFQTLINLDNAYYQDLLAWIKKEMIDGNHLFYHSCFISFLELLPAEELIKDCKDILLHLRYTDAYIQNALLECIDQALKNCDVNVSLLLKDLKQFADREMYQKIKAEDLIHKKDYPSAKRCIQEFKKNYILIDDDTFTFLEEEIYYRQNDKEAYENTIIHLIRTYSNIDESLYIDKLKSLYQDEWGNECYDFYDQLFEGFDDFFIYDILTKQEDIQYIIYYVMEYLTWDNIERYEAIIKKYDESMYHYLLASFILEESKQAKNQSHYEQIIYHLTELTNANFPFKAMEELRYLMEKANPNKKVFHDILADFMDGKEGE